MKLFEERLLSSCGFGRLNADIRGQLDKYILSLVAVKSLFDRDVRVLA